MQDYVRSFPHKKISSLTWNTTTLELCMGRGHTPWGYKEVFIGCHGYFQVIWGLQITILCSKYISVVHFQKKIPTLNHIMFSSLLLATSIFTFSISGHINMQYWQM